jgi:hypothetical protein
MKGAPVVVDHDMDRPVGVVDELMRLPWSDGRAWLAARCTITDPPEWLKRGTKASFPWNWLHVHEVNGWDCVRRSLIQEVSILSPSVQPKEPCAEVVLLERKAPEDGEVIHTPRVPIRRYFPAEFTIR